MGKEKRKQSSESKGFMLNWVIHNLLAWVIILIMFAIYWDMIVPIGGVSSSDEQTSAIMIFFIFVILTSILLGAMQKRVLQRKFQWEMLRWILATSLGFVLAFASVFWYFDRFDELDVPIFIIFAILLSIPQVIVLRHYVRRTWLWFVINSFVAPIMSFLVYIFLPVTVFLNEALSNSINTALILTPLDYLLLMIIPLTHAWITGRNLNYLYDHHSLIDIEDKSI